TITMTIITTATIIRMPRGAIGAERRAGRARPTSHDRSRRPPCSPAGRGARALAAARFEMGADRGASRAGDVALAGAVGLPLVAELSHPADGGAAGGVHTGEFPHRLFQRRDVSPVLQLGA